MKAGKKKGYLLDDEIDEPLPDELPDGPVLDDLLADRKRPDLWDADHIVPVAEGGGECDLSNIRTLCLKCHRKATAELRDCLRA